jgi:RimJ/RimL family protein N-acetyltransferase
MPTTTDCKQPIACTDEERREFARLVLQAFPAAMSLEARINAAWWLGFHYARDETLVAVAALKAPDDQRRTLVFDMAGTTATIADYRVELGWVFVDPAHRGGRIAEQLGHALLAHAPEPRVFATTSGDNAPMIRTLEALGFTRSGKPYPWRNEEFLLFLRSTQPPVEPVLPR